MLECAFTHSLQAVSNDQKSAVHGTMTLVRLREVYCGLFSELGANLSGSQVAGHPSVMVQQRGWSMRPARQLTDNLHCVGNSALIMCNVNHWDAECHSCFIAGCHQVR